MSTLDWPFAHGGPTLQGRLRATPEDFFVDEVLGFAADGAGEHMLVHVEKRGANTDWVAGELARFAGVAPLAVSYAGLKDRHAVTRQTFSVHLPGKPDPDWAALAHDEFRVLAATRHSRKLQRGALTGNRFRLVVRDVQGDRGGADARLAAIARDGVPNYFGEQRFGRDAGNLERARAMFGGRRVQRHERSLLLSAARSHLFNLVLAERVRRGDWARGLPGDVWMLAGSHSVFGPEPLDDALRERCASGDIDPTGPLLGEGALRSGDDVLAIEQAIADANTDLVDGLARNEMRQARRALRLRAESLVWTWLAPDCLELAFALPAGSYATVLMRELLAS